MAAPESMTFTFTDPERRLAAVRLWQEVRIPADRLGLDCADGVWTVTLPRPAVDRMEYLFELSHPDGGRETVLDPDNPERVGGAFGDHSVREFAGYHPPAWLGGDAPDGSRQPLHIEAPLVGGAITGELWTPSGLAADTPAPVLIAHDGPEYDYLAALTRYVAASVLTGAIPPTRVALLAPGHRDDWYSASGAYALSLVEQAIPYLRAGAPTTAVIGMGASLGALEMFVAHRNAPRAFAGLLLQSGSFFQRRYDDQESGFPGYERIVRTVSGILDSVGARDPIPVAMTCGGIEENINNNRLMARALAGQGYDVALHEVRDVHNYTAWRDCFDPHLTNLIAAVGRAGTGSPEG
jgi:enterochelin esterase family protein